MSRYVFQDCKPSRLQMGWFLGTMYRPCFFWYFSRRLITLRIFHRLFQVGRVKDEWFSARNDKWRLRIFGLSIKAFGK